MANAIEVIATIMFLLLICARSGTTTSTLASLAIEEEETPEAVEPGAEQTPEAAAPTPEPDPEVAAEPEPDDNFKDDPLIKEALSAFEARVIKS